MSLYFRQSSRRVYISILVCLISGFTFASENQFLHPKLKLGKYAIGYQRLAIDDYSANAAPRFDYQGIEVESSHQRTIAVSFWYPAKTNSGSSIKVKDYVYSYAPGKANSAISETVKLDALSSFKGYPKQQGATDDDLDKLLNTTVLANVGATPLAEKFPLILIPGGFYANFFISPTAEYFASHGYAVAYINDATSTGIGGYASSKDLLWRLSDLKQVVNLLASKPNVQWNNIGIWGYHSGGGVGTLMQMQSENVRGVVSIEGSEGWTREESGYPTLKQIPLFDPLRVRVPYMRFQSMKAEPQWYISTPENTTWEFYEQIQYADVYRVILPDAEHDDLGDGVRDNVIPAKKDRLNEEQRLLLTYGLSFFNLNLKNDITAKSLLEKQPKDAGFAENFARIERTYAKPAPPQKSDLKRAFERGGIEAMESLVKTDLSGMEPSIDSTLLVELAQELIWRDKKELQGLEIIQLAIRQFPNDYWGPYVAGFIYNRLNNQSEKVKYYQLAKARLVADESIEKDKKAERLERINQALEEQ